MWWLINELPFICTFLVTHSLTLRSKSECPRKSKIGVFLCCRLVIGQNNASCSHNNWSEFHHPLTNFTKLLGWALGWTSRTIKKRRLFFQILVYLAFLQDKCLFRLDSKPINSKYRVAWIIGVSGFFWSPGSGLGPAFVATKFPMQQLSSKRLSKHVHVYNSKHVKLQMFWANCASAMFLSDIWNQHCPSQSKTKYHRILNRKHTSLI